jgi:hypothetical protein
MVTPHIEVLCCMKKDSYLFTKSFNGLKLLYTNLQNFIEYF